MKHVQLKNTNYIFLLSLVVTLFASCSQEMFLKNPSLENSISVVDEMYNKMSAIGTYSILGNRGSARSQEDGSNNLPTFTQEDLDYLSSLTPAQLKDFQDSLISTLDPMDIAEFERIYDSNYANIYDELGGSEGMDAYLEFSTLYLETSGGIDNLQSLLPEGLSSKQTQLYVAMGVYIDKVARPIAKAMFANNPESRDLDYCKVQAELKLAMAGVGISVDALVDIMTGGAGFVLTEMEGDALALDLAGIWLEYENCNMRWH